MPQGHPGLVHAGTYPDITWPGNGYQRLSSLREKQKNSIKAAHHLGEKRIIEIAPEQKIRGLAVRQKGRKSRTPGDIVQQVIHDIDEQDEADVHPGAGGYGLDLLPEGSRDKRPKPQGKEAGGKI